MPAHIRVLVDSDFAAVVQHANQQLVRFRGFTSTSNLQTTVCLNVSECELYALVHGAAHGQGLQAYVRDFGINVLRNIGSDSSSAKAVASRRGLGKQRHAHTRNLWIQDMDAASNFVIKKVPTADILTKAIDRKTPDKHLKTLGFVEVQPSKLHKQFLLRLRTSWRRRLCDARTFNNSQSVTVHSATLQQQQTHMSGLALTVSMATRLERS